MQNDIEKVKELLDSFCIEYSESNNKIIYGHTYSCDGNYIVFEFDDNGKFLYTGIEQ